MTRSARLVLTALGAAACTLGVSASAVADGCPVPCSGQSSSPPGLKLLFVQPRGERGPLVAYDTASGAVRFSLPAGRSSADGIWHVTAFSRRGRTTLVRYHVPSGKSAAVWIVAGRRSLAAVSPSGRFLALVRGSTEVSIFDVARGRVVRSVALRGAFEVETVSADGKRLFLIQHLHSAGAPHYLVRLVDLTSGRLRSSPLRAAGADTLMTGYAWSGIGSPDGRWLLTLYLSTARSTAFVHALDLRRSSPVCIDLPSGRGALEPLKRYVLTLSPDGRRLYAANAALGVLAEIDLGSRRVVRVARFAPARATGGRPATLSGTISRNGRTLYFSGGRDLWAYDAAYAVVRGPYRTGGPLAGFGYGLGDKRVYAVRSDGRMLAFEAATGRRLRS